MDCAEIRASLLKGVVPRGDEVRAHEQSCERCAELLADNARLGLTLAQCANAPSPEGQAEVAWVEFERTLSSETGPRAWLRARPSWQRIALASALFSVLGLVGAVGRKSVEAPPFALLVSFGLVALLAVVSQLRTLGVFQGLNTARTLAGLLLVMPLVYVAALAWGGSGDVRLTSVNFTRAALACFGYGIALAIPAYGTLRLLDRRDAPPTGLRASAAALAGLIGNIALLLHCSIREPMHVLAGHFTIGAALTLLAVLVRKRD